jgi:O-succinylbenzoate synthase
MTATKKVSTLQRLAREWEDSAIELDAAGMGTAFGLDCSLAALEDEGRDDDARAAAASCWPDGSAPGR